MTYPLVVDPTINVGVEDGANDVFHTGEHSFVPTSLSIQIGSTAFTGFIINPVLMWSLPIPQASTINSAFIEFTGSSFLNINSYDADFVALASDNAVMPTDDSEYHALTSGLASEVWTISTWTAEVVYSSSDISSLVQEVVDRPGWSYGNNFLVWSPTNSANSGNRNIAYSYNSNPAKAAVLNVDYTQPPTKLDGQADLVMGGVGNLIVQQQLVAQANLAFGGVSGLSSVRMRQISGQSTIKPPTLTSLLPD